MSSENLKSLGIITYSKNKWPKPLPTLTSEYICSFIAGKENLLNGHFLKVKIVSFKIATIRAGRVAEVVRAVTQQA
jgi:hypothetical protein